MRRSPGASSGGGDFFVGFFIPHPPPGLRVYSGKLGTRESSGASSGWTGRHPPKHPKTSLGRHPWVVGLFHGLDTRRSPQEGRRAMSERVPRLTASEIEKYMAGVALVPERDPQPHGD